MEVKVITDVTTEPIPLSEIKQFCQIDADNSITDYALNIIAGGAREKLEKELNLSFATKVLMVQFNGYPIDLPYGPIQSIDSVHPHDDDTIDTVYYESGLDFKSMYVQGYDDCVIIYPVTYTGELQPFNVTYTAGYLTLPKALKQALLLQIDYDYKNQGMPQDDISSLALEKASGYSKNLFIQ